MRCPRAAWSAIHVGTADFERHDGSPPHHALLSVTDEGSGIDATTAALIFEPFFTTKGDQGTGLGLATVYGIVAQSGGHLVLDTEPGSGSTFSVYLPAFRRDTPRRRRCPAASPFKARNGSCSWTMIRRATIVSAMLANRGYEIIGAADGATAVALFESRTSPIKLVISDLVMQGVDGRET